MKRLSRRKFLQAGGASCAALAAGPLFPAPTSRLGRQEARFYDKLDEDGVQCRLCPWECVVAPGKRGRCEVRENRNGTYVSLVYGRISAYHNDPIEKKPLYHFLPGSSAFSVATAGCNVDCKFCQNWELARRRPEAVPGVFFTAEELARQALKLNCQSIAFTYNEPTVFNEFVYDTAVKARENGVKSVVISNGFINPEPLRKLCEVVDAYKVDLKSFNEKYYEDVVHGRLAPVLKTLKILAKSDVWTEIVYLVVPALNDNEGEIRDMVRWIKSELGNEVPLHFSRFYPKYKLRNLPPTPVSTIERLRDIALDGGLKYVYLGNVPGHSGENTFCPKCGKMILGRMGYEPFENRVDGGQCGFCGEPIAGVWEE